MAGAGEWCLIESDPGVLTELIRGFGVTGLQVEELWSLTEENFTCLQPIHGLIFLFKWLPGDEASGPVIQDRDSDIWFAKQVINNACATQAILSVLLNIAHPHVRLGDTLTDFRDFVSSFDSAMKGLALSNSDVIKSVHNSFARQNMFEFDNAKSKQESEDVFHFISYVPIHGRLYELDGLKAGPIDLGPIPEYDATQSASESQWLRIARPVIEKRIQKYSQGEIHFNLMAIVSDRRMLFEQQLQQLTARLESGMEISDGQDVDVTAEISHLKEQIAEEEEKRLRHKTENIRRRHNYLPLIIEILKTLGQEGKLGPLLEQAKQKSNDVRLVQEQKKKKIKVAESPADK